MNESGYQLTSDRGNSKTSDVYQESLLKVIIDLSVSNIYNRSQNFCGVGDTALVTFNN